MLAREVVRDGAGVCSRCGASGPDSYISAHHVIPRVDGGPDHPSNLESLCSACHGRESAAERAD